jgi:hypothetical protein
MNVSGQVMVGMFASHAPSLHSLLLIIASWEKCCQGLRSRFVEFHHATLYCTVYAASW